MVWCRGTRESCFRGCFVEWGEDPRGPSFGFPHPYVPSDLQIFTKSTNGICRLRVWKAACLSRRPGWGVETLRVRVYWEGSGVEPSGMERQIQSRGEIFCTLVLGVVDLTFSVERSKPQDTCGHRGPGARSSTLTVPNTDRQPTARTHV